MRTEKSREATMQRREDSVSNGDFLQCFSTSFGSAQRKFIEACQQAKIREQFTHPLSGPNGEILATDIAWFGELDAPYLLISVSGAHGVEGWAGSACQIGWARDENMRNLSADVAVLHIHAINPWGMAWDRRQQEDNIDLNRHFVDFNNLPDDSEYTPLYDSVMCSDDDPAARRNADNILLNYLKKHGRKQFGMTLQGGQYSFADAPSYGGITPSWSRQTLDHIFKRYCGHAKRIVICDFHTGYGPYGYGIPLWHMQDGTQLDKARALFGPTLEAPLALDRASDEFIQHGHFYGYCVDQLPDADVIAMCFEFGGAWLKPGERARLERQDALLWRDQPKLSDAAIKARRQWRDIHCPDRDDWREMIWFRGRQVLRELVERIRLNDDTAQTGKD